MLIIPAKLQIEIHAGRELLVVPLQQRVVVKGVDIPAGADGEPFDSCVYVGSGRNCASARATLRRPLRNGATPGSVSSFSFSDIVKPLLSA